MYKYDRNRQTFNLINALQPVYRNNGGGLFEFDRRKQHETADLIFEALTFSPTPELELAKFVRLKSVRRIAQFDDGEVRYGVHVELDEAVNINSFRIFKDDNTGGFGFFLFFFFFF